MQAYRGRFAPSPTGALHAGSMVAALASWLDARAHGGEWLVRLEDIDTPRCEAGADQRILRQLADCGLHPDAPPEWQSRATRHYQQALERLIALGCAYPCHCSRKDIEAIWRQHGVVKSRHQELVYPGTCRTGLLASAADGNRTAAWRFRVPAGITHWHDRRLGPQAQSVADAVGDFVLKRADGLWSYQLAVVVDDARQGITHVVRGEDLADNTPRQVLLQNALALPRPLYLHTPLVRNEAGEKLSKQQGAIAAETSAPLPVLQAAARALGLTSSATDVAEALRAWVNEWTERERASLYNPGHDDNPAHTPLERS